MLPRQESHLKCSSKSVAIKECSDNERECFLRKLDKAFFKLTEFAFPISKGKDIKIKTYLKKDLEDKDLSEILDKSKCKENKGSFFSKIHTFSRAVRDLFLISTGATKATFIANSVFIGLDGKDCLDTNKIIINDIVSSAQSIKACNDIISRFNDSHDWKVKYDNSKDNQITGASYPEIQLKAVKERKKKLKKEIEKEPFAINNGDKLKELESLYTYVLAHKFKAKHIEKIKERIVDTGIDNIRIASDLISFTSNYGVALILVFTSQILQNGREICHSIYQKGSDYVAKYNDTILRNFLDKKNSMVHKRKRIIRYSQVICNIYEKLQKESDNNTACSVIKNLKNVVEATGCSYEAFEKCETTIQRKKLIAQNLKKLLNYRI